MQRMLSCRSALSDRATNLCLNVQIHLSSDLQKVLDVVNNQTICPVRALMTLLDMIQVMALPFALFSVLVISSMILVLQNSHVILHCFFGSVVSVLVNHSVADLCAQGFTNFRTFNGDLVIVNLVWSSSTYHMSCQLIVRQPTWFFMVTFEFERLGNKFCRHLDLN